jgi:hypothetical protein
MTRFLIVGSICSAFLLSGAITAQAQDEHRDDARHTEERHEEVRHEEHVQARRIEDAHFRAHFGRDHHFAIEHVTVVGGRPHFAYGGYNFEIRDAWPHAWSYRDHCYIDFVNGGYYLFNLAHPGIRISVNVL